MEIAIILIFVLGYLAIALEHPLHVDKAASALILGVLCWALFVLGVQVVPEGLTDEFAHFITENAILSDAELLPMPREHRKIKLSMNPSNPLL